MIHATLYRDEAGLLMAYSAEGHAGYAKRGHDDIVCAGVSVLGATAVNSLEAICGISTDDTVLENDNGRLLFAIPCGLDVCQLHDTQILMRTLQQGLGDLEDQYPRYLKLSIRPYSDLASSTNGGRKK